MSGAAFSARGASTGQAPTTVFFGAVPDKYTMLMPYYFFNTGGGAGNNKQQLVNMQPARRIDNWVPWDSNWGGGGGSNITASIVAAPSIVAPDGTNTAFHITENNSTNYHVVVAGTDDFSTLIPVLLRFAVFAKAAERSRCWLELGETLGMNGAANFETGIRAVFDLRGGQVAVAPFYFTNGAQPQHNYVAKNSGIIPFGNGWYLCYIDVTLPNNGYGLGSFPGATHCLQAVFGPDSGSGTGAISNSYTGDGASGVYAWNTNLMPVRAYGINSVVLFDDFNSSSTIDVNNTQASGFNWYMAVNWPALPFANWPFESPVPPAAISVSNSVLTVFGSQAVPFTPGTGRDVVSALHVGSGKNYVGYGPKAPFLMEWKGKYDYTTNDNTQELAWWAQPIDWIVDSANLFNGSGSQSGNYTEVDTVVNGSNTGSEYNLCNILDVPSSGGLGVNSVIGLNSTGPIATTNWTPNISYSLNNLVAFNGLMYQSLVVGNQGFEPDISPTKWTQVSPNTPPNPTLANSTIIDYTQFHTYGTLRIPDRSKYAPFDDCGVLMCFRDGIYCFSNLGNLPPFGTSASMAYGSNIVPAIGNNNANTWFHRSDFVRWLMLIEPSNRNIYTDFVRVMEQ